MHHVLVDKYEIYVSEMSTDSLLSRIRILAVVAIVSACFTRCIAQTSIWTTVGSTVTLRCPCLQPYTAWYFKHSNYGFVVFEFDCEMSSFVYGKFKFFANWSQEVNMTYLHIVNVSSLDEGTYTCRHSFNIERWKIQIKGQPRFLNKDSSNIIHGTEGRNLTVSCILESGSGPEQLLIETGGSLVVAGVPKTLTLTLTPSRADHLAKYLCIANSSEYDIPLVDHATLYISHIPDVPANITTKILFHNVSVSWQPGNSGNLHQVFYVQYKEEGAELWTTFGPINETWSAYMTYQIFNLPYNRSHEIQVFAENDVGRSKHSEVVKCTVFLEHDIRTIWRSEIGFKCWMYVGLISASLILIFIMTQVWRNYRTQITVGATPALHSEAPYDEIDSSYYQEHPPVPHIRNNVIMASSTVETESRNNEILDNYEYEAVQQGNIRVNSSFQRNSTETVNSEISHSHSSIFDSSTGAESSDKSSDDQTEGHVNLYTSMIPDLHEDHQYRLLLVGNTEIRVHNDNDYINMRI